MAGSWSESPFNVDYLTRGYISAYSQDSHGEDFAEMLSLYVTNSQEQWDACMEEAGSEGSALIDSKLSLVRQYMEDAWGIDIDELRSVVLRREADVASGKIDLSDLTV